jgi:hypothetical protein
MKKIKYFFDCYFHQNENFNNIDNLIKEYKCSEKKFLQDEFITELSSIIKTESYEAAKDLINNCWMPLDLEETIKMVHFLYAKLTDTPTEISWEEYYDENPQQANAWTWVFCPVCTVSITQEAPYNFIEKATIIQNNQKIFICKPCKLVWLSEDIAKANAQDYKKFMHTLGLKGLWKELKDVGLL